MLPKIPWHWIDPRTWPWFVYLWLAVIAMGYARQVWRWIRQNRVSAWPVNSGRVESVDVHSPKWFARSSRSANCIAELGYSYEIAGMTYGGTYERRFYTQEEAWEFLRDLKGGVVTVHFKPGRLAASALSEASIETLLQTRPPASTDDSRKFADARSVPAQFKPFLWLFVILSAIGLVTSFFVHLGAVMGERVAPGAFFWILHMGIFVVFIPAAFVAQRRVGSTRRKDFWKLVLKDSPDWMRYMVYGFFGYAFVNFGLFFINAPTGGSEPNPPAAVWRGFSGHWMAFYSASLAILYSAVNQNGKVMRCVNGHPVQSGSTFCEKCGQPVMHVR